MTDIRRNPADGLPGKAWTVAGDAFGLIGEPDAPSARWDPAASSDPPVYRSFG